MNFKFWLLFLTNMIFITYLLFTSSPYIIILLIFGTWYFLILFEGKIDFKLKNFSLKLTIGC